MGKYHFYYDESEHNRIINLNTVNADNYYDNFIAAIIGWKAESEKLVFEKYIAFPFSPEVAFTEYEGKFYADIL